MAVEDDGPDVFVPPEGRGTALHRDRVEVRCRDSARGPVGTVVRVLEHGLRHVGGTLQRHGKKLVLQPGDPRLPASIDVVGRTPRGVRIGAVVHATLQPGNGESVSSSRRVRVLHELGSPDSARVEIEKMLLREGVRVDFPGPVRAEVRRLPSRVTQNATEHRKDLRKLGLVTIDPPDARDHDDAVWARRHRDGGFRVVIAIADVAHYVPEDSALDREAAARGCSIYLPDRVLPMLPEEISANLASLVPDRDRLAMVVDVEVGPRGGIRSSRFAEAVIRSRGRLSYKAAARVLAEEASAPRDTAIKRHRPLLRTLRDLSRVLRGRRVRQGALFLHTPVSEVVTDDRGEPTDVRRQSPDPDLRQAHGMIEEIMLLANEIVATELTRHRLATVYRVHEAPLAGRLDELAPVARALGVPLPKRTARSGALAAWLSRVEDQGLAPVLHQRLLRLMRPAAYETDNVGHFALAKEHYLHFTSPIRRYPDLVVHRLLRRLIRGDEKRAARSPTSGIPDLEKVARQARRLERNAVLLSREAQALYGAWLLRERTGDLFEATITQVDERGLTLLLDSPAVDARCPVERLPGAPHTMDRTGLRLVARKGRHSFGVGERWTARIREVSVSRREVQVEPVQPIQ